MKQGGVIQAVLTWNLPFGPFPCRWMALIKNWYGGSIAGRRRHYLFSPVDSDECQVTDWSVCFEMVGMHRLIW